MSAPLALDAPEIETLEPRALRSPHPWMRRRAQGVLHHQGLCIDQLVATFDAGRNAVSRWLSRWQRFGLAGLAEGSRAGRPPKKATAWLGAATQQARRFVPRLAHACGLHVLERTLRQLARALDYRWKRCRRSLKTRREPDAFAAMCTRPARGRSPERDGRGCVDECRF